MGVTQLNYYSNIDTSIEDLQNTVDGNFIGHHRVTLTNYNNTSLPAVAIGSVVENNGTLFKFTTETAISGSPSDGTVYIYLVPSGDPTLGTATVTPRFTNTAPTWSDSKQGWYGTSTTANYRYLEFKITKSSTSYSNKRVFTYDDNVDDLTLTTGTVTTLNSTNSTIDSLSLTNALHPRFRVSGFAHGAGAVYENTLFTVLSSELSTVGYGIKLVGALREVATSSVYITSYAYRGSSTSIKIRAMKTDGTVSELSIDSTDTTTEWIRTISW